MLGIIISGHGHFASGIYSSIELILGKQENVEIVDFPEGDTKTEIEKNIRNALGKFENFDKIIIFTDLISGSPFNVSIMEAMKNKKINVVYGTNLGMLIDTFMKRKMDIDDDTIIAEAVNIGKENVGMFIEKKEEIDEFDE